MADDYARREFNPPRWLMVLVRQRGGEIQKALTYWDEDRGGRVMELVVFWPGNGGYEMTPLSDELLRDRST